MKSTIVIPNFTGIQYLEKCLCSILADVREHPSRILVIDNGSEDGSCEAAEESVGQLPREALQGAALAAPGLHGGGGVRRRVDAAFDQPRLAASSGGGRHGQGGAGRQVWRWEPPLDGRK